MSKIHHRSYDKYQAYYARIDDALEGQDAMRANAAQYLRKMTGMQSSEFEAYARGGSYYPTAERTLRGMTGLCLTHAPTIDLPPRLEPFRQSATYQGNPLSVFIENVLAAVLSKGRYLALLDYPPDGNTVTSLPYLSCFNAESIMDWKYSLVGGKEQVTYLRLREDDDDLADEGIEQHLVCTLEPFHVDPQNEDMFEDNEKLGIGYKGRRYHVKGTDETMVGEVATPQVNGSYLKEIPMVCFSPSNLTLDIEKPPLLDIVDLNIAHWQNSVDLEHTVHLAAQPTFVRIGASRVDEKNNTIGPGAVWDLPTGGDAKVLEITGEGARVTREAMVDKEARMASLGATFITDGKVRNETATTSQIRNRSANSLLYSSLEMVEAGLTKLLQWAADWVQPNSTVTVEFSRDLVSATADPAMVGALLKADRSYEQEKDAIESEGGDINIIPVMQTQDV
jgi:hypothetical protein